MGTSETGMTTLTATLFCVFLWRNSVECQHPCPIARELTDVTGADGVNCFPPLFSFFLLSLSLLDLVQNSIKIVHSSSAPLHVPSVRPRHQEDKSQLHCIGLQMFGAIL